MQMPKVKFTLAAPCKISLHVVAKLQINNIFHSKTSFATIVVLILIVAHLQTDLMEGHRTMVVPIHQIALHIATNLKATSNNGSLQTVKRVTHAIQVATVGKVPSVAKKATERLTLPATLRKFLLKEYQCWQRL